MDEHQLAAVIARHAGHARLSARLEMVADRLPERPTQNEADELCDMLAEYRAERESCPSVLESALLSADIDGPVARALLDHIATCRTSNVATAGDLISALDPARDDGRHLCAEALGFMLRSFFDTCHHSQAMEEIAILLVANKRMTEGARAMLESRLAMMR
ncbi:MAG: hypothetical protein WC816_13345 [Sphingomonas sp.]